MRNFIQLYVKDTFPVAISNGHLNYGTAVAATEGATERESGGDKRHLSLLSDLTGMFARALKNSEDELVLEPSFTCCLRDRNTPCLSAKRSGAIRPLSWVVRSSPRRC